MSEVGTGVFGYRWEGYQHAELYDMVRLGAAGSSVIAEAEPSWVGFVTLMNESRDRIDRLQQEAGVSWAGQAAGAMTGSVSPLSRWAQESATAAEQSNSSLGQIVDGFARVRNSMPEPVPVPSKMTQGLPGDFAGIVSAQTDEDADELRAQQAHLQAVELMNAYTASNQHSTDTAGTFTEPPDMAVSAVERAEAGGRAGSFVDSGGEPGGGGAFDEPGGREPSGGSGSAAPSPGPGGLGGTDPARATLPGASPVGPGGTSAPVTSGPFAPVTGVLTDPITGRLSDRGGPFGSRGSGIGDRTGSPRGSGGTSGGPGGPGGTTGGPGRTIGGPGGTTGGPGGGQGGGQGRGVVGTGPVGPETTRGTAPAGGARGGIHGSGFGPVGSGARGDEDKEHTSPEYLRSSHDDFWDDTPPVAPPVLGAED